MKAKFYLELELPYDNGSEGLAVPVGFVWQEGPDDLHIQFDGPGGDNYWPKYVESCRRDPRHGYLVPSMSGAGNEVTKGLSFSNRRDRKYPIAHPAYIERLKKLWS